jgi:hypothetical protein
MSRCTRYLSFSLVNLALVAASAGCQSQAAGDPVAIVNSVVPVSGQVRFADGRPVANAWVVFHPKDPPGNEASAGTGPDGTFHLGTFAKEDGAVPGRYVITVEPHPNMKKAAPRIPKKYVVEATSTLTAVIANGGAMTLPAFELK